MKLKNKISLRLDRGQRRAVAGAPEGAHPLVLAAVARTHPGGVVHVARDDRRLDALVEGLRFFAPDCTVLAFPAWDCLPYDRVSPNPDIVNHRMATLGRLAAGPLPDRLIVVTTVNAVLQRVAPRASVGRGFRSLVQGERIEPDGLLRFLADNGYIRVGTVVEAGEFAARGGLVDVFPPGAEEPLRLDFFGSVLESIRTFEPTSQRSTGRIDRVDLKPVGEVRLDPRSVERFRAGYTALFGVPSANDVLYATVSEGRRHPGVEHWLPLFHESLETLFDYLPDSAVTLDHLAEDSVQARFETIADYCEARHARANAPGSDVVVYKPLPADRLYLTPDEWRRRLGDAAVAAFSPFAAAEEKAGSVDLGAREGRNFAPERQAGGVLFDAVGAHLATMRTAGRRCLLACYSAGSRDRLVRLLADHGVANIAVSEDWAGVDGLPQRQAAAVVVPLERGFAFDDLVVLSEQDILGDRIGRPPRRAKRAANFIAEVADLSAGDLVIHVDHGIGKFEGLRTIDVAGAPHDCVLLVYDGGDRLFLPVENIEMLSRYGSEEAAANLDKLGSTQWQARKARVKKRLKDMAQELIRIAAQRELHATEPVLAPEHLYDEFCARFPFHETEDQKQTIDDVLEDLSKGRPMDRLVCGDVGFGKTEVALRTAFVVAMSGRQVAVIAPTTLLARQHYKTFRERFAGLPVRVGQLSRLVPAKEAAETRRGAADGTLDVVIGTHALLGKAVHFRDLGLVVIDEEQHFGVKHKERLKQFRANVHVLTLTATPIPRTLQLALSGVRELSLIATPPVDRLAVRTFILPFDPLIVREAILREHYRGGQTYYVCPRIADLEDVGKFLRSEVPEVKFDVVHGQLVPTELERVMNAFYDRAFDVLLCTNIIESGLDISTVNTLIVHRADMFGLSQLYQIRGRVGRSKVRAYAYLTVPANRTPSEGAEKRLEVMQSLDGLGAGFSLASHDLDIRGSGNLLGEEQSGHVREVGLELYQQMLEEAVTQARAAKSGGQGTDGEGGEGDEPWSPQIQIGTSVLIPEKYVGDLNVRMGLYRRLAKLSDRTEIDGFAAELIDRFGPLPDEVEHLLRIVRIKHVCRQAEVERIEAGPKGATVAFRNQRFANPAGLVDYISRQAGTMKLRPDQKVVYLRAWDDVETRLQGVEHLVERLAEIARSGAAAAPPVAAAASRR